MISPHGFSAAVRVLNLSTITGLADVVELADGDGVTSSTSAASSRILVHKSALSTGSQITTEPAVGCLPFAVFSGTVNVRTFPEESPRICLARSNKSFLLKFSSIFTVEIAAFKKLVNLIDEYIEKAQEEFSPEYAKTMDKLSALGLFKTSGVKIPGQTNMYIRVEEVDPETLKVKYIVGRNSYFGDRQYGLSTPNEVIAMATQPGLFDPTEYRIERG